MISEVVAVGCRPASQLRRVLVAPLRPAVVLRMPNFHMSSDEASKLVDYFAARSNSEFPYEYNNRRRRGQ